MVPLFPTCKTEGEQVPYMAVGNDDSWQRIASGKTEMSGEYIVEAGDVGEEEEEEERIDRKVEKKMRRLRFLQNQQFVQTEVQLTAAQEEEDGEEAPSLVSCDEDGDKNLSLSVYLPSSPLREPPQVLRVSGVSKDDERSVFSCLDWTLPEVDQSMEGLSFDYDYVDSHHAAALAVMCLCPQLLLKSSNSGNSGTHSLPRSMIIGLGGGAFPMFVQRYLPRANHYVCDIDPGLLEIAVHYFGYAPKPQTIFVPREGVSMIQELASTSAASTSSSSPVLQGGQI